MFRTVQNHFGHIKGQGIRLLFYYYHIYGGNGFVFNVYHRQQTAPKRGFKKPQIHHCTENSPSTCTRFHRVYHHNLPLSQSLAFEQLLLCLTALIGQKSLLLLSSLRRARRRRRRRRRRQRQRKTLQLSSSVLCRAMAYTAARGTARRAPRGGSQTKLRPPLHCLACEPSYEPPTSARLMVYTKRSLLARNCRSLAKTCHFKARISHFSLYLA